ncbi:MAG: 2,3-bisphosphoglycerate-independent phosphoglycerate mutase [Alphaproteobacteria bacterium]|nr:2,3-bisphosphoglycerate-independent phosphoglycerate mutase [Alphaproteobacteria bacterium]
MSAHQQSRPVVLCILDGWGQRPPAADNAIALAATPVWDRLLAACPHGLLETSGRAVGLPQGQMGNSEVGHMNIGAGRVVLQDLPRIDGAIADGSLAANRTLGEFIAALEASGGRCHLCGLLSPGGVHSHQDHMVALAGLLSRAGVAVAVHAFLDGRDTPPRSAAGYLAEFTDAVAGLPGVALASLCGRYYAMDRDQRWQRLEKAHALLLNGDGEPAADAAAAIAAAYAAGQSDEFVTPRPLGGFSGMRDGDGVLAANFRADRMRQIMAALVDPDFAGFARPATVSLAAAAGMSEYAADLEPYLATIMAPLTIGNTLGQVVAEAGLRQLRIAETEKYAHVTFFLNGGREAAYAGEERLLEPSPKVATYDLQPEMSAPALTENLVAAIEGGDFDLIVANYANGDMVGHTGNLAAAMTAAECLDACLGRLVEAISRAGGRLLISADHGNAEKMGNSEQPFTAHTSGPVAAILVNPPAAVAGLHDGCLADLAPTVLALMGLAQPAEMTGSSLLRSARAG